jgi:hypothetical protein
VNEALSLTLHSVKSPTDLEVMALLTGDELDDLARANAQENPPNRRSDKEIAAVLSLLDSLETESEQ